MSNSQRETKEWLAALARHLNLSVSQVALNSGLAASTLTRFLNDTTGSVTITQSSLEKVASYSGFRPLQFPGRQKSGATEPDTIRFELDNEPRPAWLKAAVAAAVGSADTVEAWIMKGGALDAMGVMPGDVVLFDTARRARLGDIVLVSIWDYATGAAETVMRVYQPPYIVSHSMRLGPQRPETVDEDRVAINGAAIGFLRA